MTMTTRMSDEQKRLLRNHASRNIAYLLDKLAIAYVDRGNNIIQATCPATQHGGDRNNCTAFSWRTDIGKWVCWTHHCEDKYGNDIFGLVSSVLELNFKDTTQWLNDRLAEKQIDILVDVTSPVLKRNDVLHVHEPLKEEHIKFLKPDPIFLIQRGFSKEVLRDYQVGLWDRLGTFMCDRVIVPIRDHEGFLVGYSGRTIHPKSFFEDKGLQYKKWLHARYFNQWPKVGDLFISSILFNLNRSKRLLNQQKSMIIVEGPLDGFKLEMSGIHNWVATLGTKFSHNHRSLLVKYGVTDLYIAYDNDEETKAGEEGFDRLKRVVGDMFHVHKVDIPGHDCGDLTIEQLQDLFKGIGC